MQAGTESSPAHAAPQACGRGLKILIVEDNDDCAESTAMLLRLLGHEAEIAKSGLQALEMLQTALHDVILLDIRLPGTIDGWMVAERVKTIASKKRPFLIALTGMAREIDHRRSAEAGVDLHLNKPVDIVALERLMRRFQLIDGPGEPGSELAPSQMKTESA